MDPAVLAEFEAAQARLRDQRARIERYRRPGLLLGGAIAFLLGGFIGLATAFLLVAIARAVGHTGKRV